ncbi:unnamed protein product [Peronospora destructor]|uniref:Uncharacterized protein n=1 Tax=Peronospora destructor TaxID=86335 RepID=A0AAV0U1S1_9STRA|nr:unnamed protein product [Peronospora destructor]
MENSCSQEPSVRITPDQQQRLREACSSPMCPSQYTRGTKDSVNNERTDADRDKSEKETLRQVAVRREHERVSMEKVLLDRRWVFHCASPLFYFHRDKLSAYAHDLVKTLRAAALRACDQQFGYSVNIRTTDTFVAVQIREEREKRCSRAAKTVVEQQVPRKGRERQQALLLRGDEELLRWVCSWLQRRFQCVVSTHVVRIQQMNLKRLARNLAVASLLAEEGRLSRARRDMNNDEEELSRGSFMAAQEPLRAPLLLKYRATKAEDVVRTYTLTVPWETLRRLFQQTKDGPGDNRPSTYVPELTELTERLYVDVLPFDLSTYEIERIELQEVAIDLDGGVELYSMDLVHTVLFSLLELLAIQDVLTASRLETTL